MKQIIFWDRQSTLCIKNDYREWTDKLQHMKTTLWNRFGTAFIRKMRRLLYSPHQTLNFFFVIILFHLLDIELHIRLRVQGVFLEIGFLEKCIHVETFGAEMIRPRNIRDDAFAAFLVCFHSHPHIPVPEEIRGRPFWLKFVLVQPAF